MINKIKGFYAKKVSYDTRIRNIYKWRSLKALFHFFNLDKMARIHQTDKFGAHYYTPNYHNHFRQFRWKKIKLLEIGIGGYDNEIIGGHSLRMWKSYFPFAEIFAFDIIDKTKLQEKRIKIFKGSQVDEDFLKKLIEQTGTFDIIVDDGSHLNEHVIKTFQLLFPKVNDGGYYVIEDTQTSYWESYGGTSEDFNDKNTMYYFFKSLIDGLNHEEFDIPNYKKSYFDKHIVAMHFYHNMIFIKKGNNDEPSNFLKNNQFIRPC